MAGLDNAFAAARGGRRDLTDKELWGWQEALEDARDQRLALYARLDRAETTLARIRAYCEGWEGHSAVEDILALLDAG